MDVTSALSFLFRVDNGLFYAEIKRRVTMNNSTTEYVEKWVMTVQSKGYVVLNIRSEDGKLIATLKHPRGYIRDVTIRRLTICM